MIRVIVSAFLMFAISAIGAFACAALGSHGASHPALFYIVGVIAGAAMLIAGQEVIG